VQQVDAALVELLSSLFGAPELRRLLQRETWGVKLVLGITSSEQTAPNDWFHDLVVAVNQRGMGAELRVLLLRERDKRAAEIRAVLPDVDPARVAVRAVEVTAAPRAVVTPPRPKPAPADARPAPQGWSPVRVLHLSDLHFSAKTAWDSDTVLGRLAADVARLRGEVGEIDLVVVTGDIANHGTAEEYTQATAWLTGPLAQAAGVEAAQIRVVPGNHDVHRGSITKVASALARGLLADDDLQQSIAEVLEDASGRAPLLARQAAYLTFAQTFHPGLAVPWWSERPVIRGLTVHLAGLNSAWLSASDSDRGNLILSRWQCHQLLAGADDADLTIALLHHPWDYLAEHDQQLVEEEIRRRCGVILHGHLHQQKARLTSDPDRDVLQLAAGASYAGSKWANAYQLLELVPMRGEARIHFRVWDGHDWIPDRNRYQKAPDGVATLPLRRSPNAPKSPPDDAPTEDITDAPIPVRTPRERYAALLKDQLDKLPDTFRIEGGPRTVEDIYVEVHLAENYQALKCEHGRVHKASRDAARRHMSAGTEPQDSVSLQAVVNSSHHRRWVLLGDPGSGKTTLLRHLAVEMLGRADGPLPIYLKVAELEHGLSKAIMALCACFHAPDLAKFVLGEAHAGRAVLLIDGLDEAVDNRAGRPGLISAAIDVGESQVIVASRPIGYFKPSVAFRTLAICPLDTAQQEDLLTRWVYDRAKVRGAIKRLGRFPRLCDLTENPLLLTLVGLLLCAGQDVPSRRGDLYERAIKLLLSRDHNAEDAAPVAPMREPDLTLELLGWAALRLHGLEGEVYRRDALITALEADARNAARLGKHWPSPAAFIAEVAERTGLLIPDTGRVRDANAYSFPHRTIREFLAATALERDMGAVAAGVSSGGGELSRVFNEGKARPERWAEVLALTCGRLGPGGADALVRRITEEANTALLLRVVADAEGISADTVRGTLKLELGWERDQLQARQKVIEEIPGLVKDLAVAVGLLEQIARSTTCGHDLFWVREVLRRIERGEVNGGGLDGSLEDAKRAAKGAADNVLGHLDAGKRETLLALLKPWWREIPAGSFEMGSTEYSDEKPIHRVTFTSGFHMLGVPVTWAMYRLFDPGHDAAREAFGGKLPPEAQDEVPVYNVSWFASVMFAEWVGARLPLEPEWEYACRAGTKTRFWSGDTDADLARVGWHGDSGGGGNAQGHPHPVAQKPKNAWGLHDVHRNVWEWCAEVYNGEAYAARADGLTVDPLRSTFAVGKTVPMSAESADRGASRVLRGGSWHVRPEDARSANRSRYAPSSALTDVGFRLLLCPPERP
jgi:formylglycine-generating enzyme required for sulfatase activity/predicted phosphodiesterase